MTGVVVLGVVLLSAVALGLWRRATDGRLRRVAVPGAESPAPRLLTPDDIGAGLGERATLVQFSSAFCAPCRSTRVLLEQVAQMLPGVTHVEIDAESNLALVRDLEIRRTPTVFILDGAGRVRTRAAGAPRKVDVIAALGEFL